MAATSGRIRSSRAIYVLAAIQAFFLVALIASKRSKSAADHWLAIWLAGIGLHTSIYFLEQRFTLASPLLLNLNASFPFLQGPLLLGYVAALVGMRERPRVVDLLHLLPFLAFIVYALSVFGASWAPWLEAERTGVSIYSVATVFSLWLLVSVPVYIGWSLLVLRRVRRALPPGETPPRLRWIHSLIVMLGLVWVAVAVAWALQQRGADAHGPHLVFVALTVFVYALGYLGVSRTAIFSQAALSGLREQLGAGEKYRKSGLRGERAEAAYRELLTYMDAEQPHRDGELTLQSLARPLGLSVNHLSQVINEFEQRNFHDFVNARRVAAAQALLSDPGGSDRNLLEVAMECGFNSKSSFNRAFRRFAHTSPSQYRQRASLRSEE